MTKKHKNDPNIKFPGTISSRLQITKIAENKPNSNGISIGTIRTGTLFSNFILGDPLTLMYCEEKSGRPFKTSVILTIDFKKQSFTTSNSTYSYKIIN